MTKRILRIADVINLTGIPKSSIYKEMKDGIFPKSVKLLNSRACGWYEDEIQNFINSRRG